MRVSNGWFKLVSLFVVLSIQPGCQSFTHSFTGQTPPTPPRLVKILPGKKLEPTPALKACYEVFEAETRIARQLFEGEKFAELEKLATEYRETKARLVGGRWKLTYLYNALSSPPNRYEASETEWRAHLEKIQRWQKAFPKSQTPLVEAAMTLTDYGWKARGSGTADRVTKEGWRLFAERLQQAEEKLKEAQKLPGNCPTLYRAWLTVALGQNWEKADYDRLFEEAVKVEPLYLDFYVAKAVYLLPRWHGERGDWERFALETETRVGGDEGKVLYYYIAVEMHSYYQSRFFQESSISWEHLKAGFEASEKLYGTNVNRANFFLFLCWQANDQKTARNLRQIVGENWDPSTWGTEPTVTDFKNWLRETPPQNSGAK
ncbi:MAG: DUF4034 domain-containing protein [Blastocatellia bacterium]|nr:DUF4034 domain-containing protein [Blastocatellia bacterium]